MTTTHTPFTSVPTHYIGTVCQSRTELLDRLAVTLESLGEAALQLKTSLEIADSSREFSLRSQIAKLRDQCARIRSELQSHRASHGC